VDRGEGEKEFFFGSLDIGDRERLYFKATDYPLKLILTSSIST
jgi:hypothetical protein